MRGKMLWSMLLAMTSLVCAMLACAANAANMQVSGVPEYVCPSSTPRPTSPPTYPTFFVANLNYYYIDPTRNVVQVQYLAQNTGAIYVSSWGTYPDGSVWSSGSAYAGYAGSWPGGYGSYAIALPSGAANASITVTTDRASGYTFSVAIFTSPVVSGSPNPPPGGGLPAPVYPTPVPTPTPYSIPPYNNSFYFLDDPVYSFQPPIHLRMRMLSPINSSTFALPIPFLNIAWTAATWTIQITNVGTTEYDFLGAGYLYISEISSPVAGTLAGVWSPSHEAASFLGIVEQGYDPRALMPGQTLTVTVAAWIPSGSTVTKVSFNLDPYNNGDPGWATFTPTQGRVATWINQKNSICVGEIQYP